MEDKDLARIVEREEPGSAGPWKWQIVNRLDEAIELLRQLVKQEVGKAAKSKAGKASAEARRKKFGSADPKKIRVSPVIQVEISEPAQMEIGHDGSGGNPGKEVSVREQKPKKKKGELSDGARIWHSFAACYNDRYGVDPLRNVKVNSQCSQIAKQVGVERGVQLVAYYLTRSDMMYVKSSHPIGLCLLDLQKLATQSETNTMVSHKDAQRAELEHANDRAIDQYLSQQNPVREREVENADS